MMKRLLLTMLVSAGLVVSSSAAPRPTKRPSSGRSSGKLRVPEPTVLRQLKVADIKTRMRVKLQLKHGRPMIGVISRATETDVYLDMSYEADGLPAKFRFKRKDIVSACELAKQTDEERDAIRSQRQQVLKRIKIETREEYAKRKADKKAEKVKKEEEEKAFKEIISSKQEEQMRKLLEEFPPEAWNEAKYNEIRDNWWLRDLMPTDKERRFASVIKAWRLARDTIPLIDAKKNSEKGTQLLLKFPPSEGWGTARLEAIAAKETKGEKLSDAETEFRKSYEAWSAAVGRREAEVKAEAEKKKAEGEAPQ